MIRPMQPRWEDDAFDAGRRVAVIAADGSVRYASSAADLEPLVVAPLTRFELREAERIMAGFGRRRAA